jgi:hypothetical protein
MTVKEEIYSIVDVFSEKQLSSIAAFFKDLKRLQDDETEEELDMAFCVALAERHDKREDKDAPGIPIEDLATELGIVLGEDDED